MLIGGCEDSHQLEYPKLLVPGVVAPTKDQVTLVEVTPKVAQVLHPPPLVNTHDPYPAFSPGISATMVDLRGAIQLLTHIVAS